AQAGARLILAARRLERLEQVVEELQQAYAVPVHCLQMDVRDRPTVESTLESLPTEWADIEILINNAGLSRGLDPFQDSGIEDWEEMIDTNLKGLLYVTRFLLPGMISRGRGHVVNLGSIAGHQTYPKGHVYCATKAAVRAITEGLKQDLLGTPIRITSVDPGLVETEFSVVRFHGDTARAKGVYQGLTPLTPADVADVILFCVTRPAHVNLSEILMVPTDQATATLVHRQP
ncbi:MAG: SDR family NAD(P)-dependent oxidoreductase, partial [Leptolyngbyaceae bacterium]|nr:SDR family NAD(P)-dependent oxidoreductase [Leptolyngbyaceae bacterium]